MKRKMLAFTLSFMMGITCFPQSVLSLSAEEEEDAPEATLPEETTEDTDTEEVELSLEKENEEASASASVEIVYDGYYEIYTDSPVEMPVKYVLPSSEYTTVLKVGGYTDELEDDHFEYEFTIGKDFTFKNEILTLNTAEMFKKWQGQIAIYAAVFRNGSFQCSETRYLYLTEPVEEYSHWPDETLLPGWDGFIMNWDIVYVMNNEFPNGEEYDYDVIGAEVVNESPKVKGEKVLEIEVITPEMDPVYPGWKYTAVSAGEADIKISYKKLNGETDFYLKHVTVSSERYEVELRTEDGRESFLPGTQTTLYADVIHSSSDPEQDGNLDGLTYEWVIDDYVLSYMTLTQDPKKPNTAKVVFKDDETTPELVMCFVDLHVYDQSGEQVADQTIFLTIAKDFYSVYPTTIDPVNPGESKKITVELRHYTYDSGSYTPAENVHYYWGYEPTAIEVYDKDGKLVGFDENGEYMDSAGSSGGAREFTIVRKNDWMTNLRLEAELSLSDTERSSYFQNYWFNSASSGDDSAPTSISFADASMEMPTAHAKMLEVNVLPESADSSVTWSSSNEKVATVDQDGVVSAKTYGKAVITAASAVNPKLKAEITVQTRFYDVNDSTQSYYKPVYWGADNGVVAGFNGGEYFGPDDDCTRAQFVTFLWRLAGKPTGTKDVSFPDVDPKANYFRAVKWAVSQGIIVGFKHDNAPATFEPDGLVTRGQVATMLWRYAGKKTPELPKTSPFKDINSSNSAYRAVVWGQKAGVIKGYKDGTFQPDASCLRQHIVTFLYRYARDVMHKNVN